jgi:hypothetical protein
MQTTPRASPAASLASLRRAASITPGESVHDGTRSCGPTTHRTRSPLPTRQPAWPRTRSRNPGSRSGREETGHSRYRSATTPRTPAASPHACRQPTPTRQRPASSDRSARLDPAPSGTRTSTASAATPSPPSRQQSYDRCATRTHAIARTTASSDVTVRGSFCGTGGIALRWLYVRRGARRPSEAVMRSRARSGASRRIARVRSAQPVPRRARWRPR